MLPVEDVLPQLLAALETRAEAVLVAPPGAGKTTRVAPALLNAAWINGGKIILLSPRRLAARAAASRMAFERGEQVGGTIGYRVRLDSKISRATRIEVVTEGVFTRMILDDPGLSDVGCVIFDEFHDLAFREGGGLALARDGEPGVLVTDSTFTQILCAPQIGPATAVAFSPNGDMLAVGTERGTLALVAVDGCRTMQEAVAHDGGVADIAFSPDGGWLVTGGGDGTMKFFTAEGKLTATLKAGAPVTAVAVEYAAGRVASVDAQGQLVLWGVPTE